MLPDEHDDVVFIGVRTREEIDRELLLHAVDLTSDEDDPKDPHDARRKRRRTSPHHASAVILLSD
jgi:rhodanese-related sulfurtransferase